MDFRNIADLLNQGLILINQDMTIAFWNSWMEKHSRIPRDRALGKKVSDIFPELESKGFFWKVQNVLQLGIFAFFSQPLHHYIFPLPSEKYLDTNYEHMQQNVCLAPIHDANGHITQVLISVVDDTDAANYRDRLEKTMQALEETNRIDHLTQVYNRRYLMECLNEEISFHERSGKEFSLVILDIDFFKTINDTHGHLCGDHVLVNLANLLQKLLRPYDKISRYGGEEFCLLLPQTNLESGLVIAERIRAHVAANQFFCPHQQAGFTITISLGVACTESFDRPTIDLMLQKADEALYMAKDAGRNTVRHQN